MHHFNDIILQVLRQNTHITYLLHSTVLRMLLLYGCTEVKEHNLVFFSHSVMSDSLQPHGLQHARPPCPSPTPRACSNSCPSSPYCHPTISSSVVHFSSCPQSFPALGAFPMIQPFASSGQSIGASASASIFPVNIQG